MNYVEDLFSLKGKTAVIVGGAGVLGGLMTKGLVKAGADALVADAAPPEKLKAAADDFRKELGKEVPVLPCDVTKKENLEKIADEVIKRYNRLDIVINAAGINSATPFFEITPEEWQKIMDINLRGTFWGCQVFCKKMIELGNGGSVINIASVSSGPPLSKVFTYSTSKAGVVSITQFLAKDLAQHKIRVNALMPGFFPAEQNRKILTEERVKSIMNHTPMNRFGEPEELIGAVIYLASAKASSFVTGHILRIDGGFTAQTI